jgi:hypothetical protein
LSAVDICMDEKPDPSHHLRHDALSAPSKHAIRDSITGWVTPRDGWRYRSPSNPIV